MLSKLKLINVYKHQSNLGRLCRMCGQRDSKFTRKKLILKDISANIKTNVQTEYSVDVNCDNPLQFPPSICRICEKKLNLINKKQIPSSSLTIFSFPQMNKTTRSSNMNGVIHCDASCTICEIAERKPPEGKNKLGRPQVSVAKPQPGCIRCLEKDINLKTHKCLPKRKRLANFIALADKENLTEYIVANATREGITQQ